MLQNNSSILDKHFESAMDKNLLAHLMNVIFLYKKERYMNTNKILSFFLCGNVVLYISLPIKTYDWQKWIFV